MSPEEIAAKGYRLEAINTEKRRIHSEIANLNTQLGHLATEAWGLQCDISNAILNSDGRPEAQPGSVQPTSMADAQ